MLTITVAIAKIRNQLTITVTKIKSERGPTLLIEPIRRNVSSRADQWL